MSSEKQPRWVQLPAVAPHLFPPSQSDRDEWAAHYGRTLARLTSDGVSNPEAALREDVEYMFRSDHPSVIRFHIEALELAIDQRARPPVGWRDVDSWTREDYLARVEQDKREGGRGSKRSIARRALVAPSVLWRHWERVRREGESWPSGEKGPADRR